MCLTVRQVSVRFAFISRADILFFWKGLAIII